MGESKQIGFKTVKVLFMGQCLNYGYAGVPRAMTFNHVAASLLRVRFPHIPFAFRSKYLYHPRGLNALLKHRMAFARPDLLIIGLPALFAATSWRVNRVYEMAPEIVDTARSFLQKLNARRNQTSYLPMKTPLDNLFRTHAPLDIDEYERLVEDAVKICLANSCRVILLGPGRFNEDSIEGLQRESPELYAAVNQMVKRVARRQQVPMIDAHDALLDYSGEVFTPNNHRWSCFGHEVMAREVESVLAAEIPKLHLASL